MTRITTDNDEKNAAAIPSLPTGRYRLVFKPETPDEWRGFAGSAWRGVLGHSLKRLVCVNRNTDCPACLLYRSCVYPYVFETPPPPDSGKMRRYTAAPHPFVLAVPWGFSGGGQPYHLGLTLFGAGNRYLAYLTHALRSAALDGLRGAPKMALEFVEQEDAPGAGTWRRILEPGSDQLIPLATPPPRIPPTPPFVRLDFRTPLRLRNRHGYIDPENLRFSDLFRNLLRRISMLTYFHSETPLETSFRALTQASMDIGWTAKNVQWRDWTRYSSRQQTKMRMGGLCGQLELDSTDLDPFWPYLWLGQWTHAGKGTSMGLGEYTLLVPH